MASKLVPSIASVVPINCPWSSLGRNPLGTITPSHTVAASRTNENMRVANRCRITKCRLRS